VADDRPTLHANKIAKSLERLEKEVGPAILRGYAEEFVRHGLIDATGKNIRQIQAEVVSLIERVVRAPRLFWTVDFTPHLLREARRLAKQGHTEVAALLYATWFEHWVNNLIGALASRKEFSREDGIQITRETSFRAKTTWVLRLLGFAPIDKRHLNLLQLVYDSRNAFVHYKWKPADVDDELQRKETKRLEEAIRQVGRTIRYLRLLENRYFFKGKKRGLVPAILRKQTPGRPKTASG